MHTERGALACLLFALAACGTTSGPAAQRGETKTNSKDGLSYVSIPAGSFTIGCSPQDKECFSGEKPPSKITLTKGFWLGETEVTQDAYQRVMGKNPSRFKGGNLPVEQVTWIEADKYCHAVGGRLPTEAEWEYAARGGSPQLRYGELDQVAWYAGNSKHMTHPVGQKQPNAFGLRDMLGNVLEWTGNWYTPQLASATDPTGPPAGEFKALRGGGWFDDPELVRVSYRSRIEDDAADYNIGFRCATQ